VNPFELHAELLQHASRGGIARKVAPLHSVQSEFREGERRQCPRRFCCVPVTPLTGRDPVAKLSMAMRLCDLQTDCA
jgi:hypothetical protein